jgi:DNA-binding transcriptional LysR family regulator
MDRFTELEVFVEVIERGDYSSAARSLKLTPSAVSKSVARLERRLGAHLLERSSRRMRPTRDGDALYSRAKQAVVAVAEAEASVSGSLGADGGDLRIHLPPTFAIHQVARLVPEFRERYPKIRLNFILRDELPDLAENRIDASIVIGRPEDSDLLVRRIGSSRWVICAAPTYLERHGAPLCLDDLANHECLGSSLDDLRKTRARSESPERSGLALPATCIAANNGSMLQALAREGVGIVRLAEYHVSADLAAGRLIQLFADEEFDTQDIQIVYPPRMRTSVRLRLFIDFIQEKLASERWSAPQRRAPPCAEAA